MAGVWINEQQHTESELSRVGSNVMASTIRFCQCAAGAGA
jgi:hypothetical protein